MIFLVCILPLAVLLCLPAGAGAQVTTARLEGVVRDSTGAIIPGATVVVTNVGTNIPYEALTNDAGFFFLPQLPPGTYTVSCELKGFKRSVVQDLRLQVGDTRTVQLTLEPGEISEQVLVTAEATPVDLTSQNIRNVVQERQITDLPLNGRNAMNLFYLQAGANPLVASRAVEANPMFNQQQVGTVDGLRVVANNVTVEGIWAQDPMLDNGPGMVSMPTPVDALAEYTVVTSSAAAEFGRGAGAQIQAIYKSGTNEFHGTVYEFNRNTVYNANNFFLNKQPTKDGSKAKRPVFLRNQYGFSLGGPIKRERIFFFGTWEGQRERQAQVINRTVFTQTLRDGNFRYYNKGANSASLVDPLTGAPKVPAADISTINLLTVDSTRLGADSSGKVAAILKQVPLPNNYEIGDGFNRAGYRYTSALPSDYDQFVIKGDFVVTSKHRASWSVAYSNWSGDGPKAFSGYPEFSNHEIRKGSAVALNSSFSPTLLNEFRAGAAFRGWHYLQPNPASFDTKGNYQLVGLGTGRGAQPNGNPVGVFLTQESNLPVYNFNDNVTKIKGNHTLKAGVDIRISHSRVNFGGDAYIPVISTDNAYNPANIPALPGLNSNDRALAQQLTNDLTGTIGYIQQDFKTNSKTGFTPFEPPIRHWLGREYSLFFQDTWKVTPHLTANLGVRYEIYEVPRETGGLFTQPAGGVLGILGVAGPLRQPTQTVFAEGGGSKVYRVDKNNIAPNIGFTWDPFKDGKSSVSANYRLTYDRVALVQHLFLDFNNEGTTATVILYPYTRFSDPNIYQAVGGKAPIFPIPTPAFLAPAPNRRAGIANTVDPSLYVPYTGSWSLRIQRELWARTALSVAYVGNKATGLHRAYTINQIEIRNNGFLSAFQAAQRNLAANGNPNVGESVGVLGRIFPASVPGQVASIPAALNTSISQGQAARVADQIDRGLVGGLPPGQLLQNAGLPDTFFRFNPQFNNAWIVGNNSNSTYHGLKVEATRRYSAGVYFQVNYTFGKGLTDYLGGQAQSDAYRDNLNYRLDKSLQNFNATHVINANGLFELPFGKGKRWLSNPSAVVNHLVGGWQVNGLFGFTSGWPMTVDTGRYNLTLTDTSTANYNGTNYTLFDKIIKGDLVTTLTAEEKSRFTNPPEGSAGNTPQRAFPAFNFINFDTSVFKEFRIQEDKRFQLRFEFFNVFNHTRFDMRYLTTNINSATFGVVTAALNPRIIQMAGRFIF
jgi:hypothetical protein